jgi:hypothetical protein
MRRLVPVVLALLLPLVSPRAEAQPAVPPLPVAAEASSAWYATRAVSLQRFAEGGPALGEVAAGAELALVLMDGAMARVRHRADIGWVPADALSRVPPAAALPADAPAPVDAAAPAPAAPAP